MADDKITISCGVCGAAYFKEDWGIGEECALDGCIGRLVDPAVEKPKRTRKTNPLRWARHLSGGDAPKKLAKEYPWLVDGEPQHFGPEFPTPTPANEWLATPGNTNGGFVHTLVRITERDIIAMETKQIELIRRIGDGDYVGIGEASVP